MSVRGNTLTQTVTVGIDIGTTSVKGVAADADGNVLARVRVPHRVVATHPGELAHDAAAAWFAGPRIALDGLLDQLGPDVLVAGVNVAAMVPSLCAVDAAGVPISDGLLYGDERGALDPGNDDTDDDGAGADPSSSGELVRFLASLRRSHPDAAGYWPAQAVANASLGGVGAIDTTTAMTTLPLFDFTGWDVDVARGAGLDDIAALPRIVVGSTAVGPVLDAGGTSPAPGSSLAGARLGGGTIDALGEQLVAGADQVGDVLVILGATLIVWAVVPEWIEAPGVWTVPHTAPGLTLVGGPSNAGGLFQNWVRRVVGEPSPDHPERPADPTRVPVALPYLRGERVPIHDATRRASLHDLDIATGPDEVRRAGYEASGFAIRHMLDLAALTPKRLVVTGGGTHDAAWLAALADATGCPVDVVATAEGAALGAAYLARLTAGLETSTHEASRWARTDRRIEPDAAWVAAAEGRYRRYRALSDAG